jgi:hypothetical protein
VLPSEPSYLEGAPNVPKVAEMAVLGVDFEHLYTDVNGVGNRDISDRDLSSAIRPLSPTSAASKNGRMTPEISRHPPFTDSFLSPG